MRNRLWLLSDEFVVFLMRANPDPFNAVADLVTQCSIMIANANRKAFGTPAELLEVKRWMTRDCHARAGNFLRKYVSYARV
jgi:hypothetical protein